MEQTNSQDYPLGGMAEPFDIEREKELTGSDINLVTGRITPEHADQCAGCPLEEGD